MTAARRDRQRVASHVHAGDTPRSRNPCMAAGRLPTAHQSDGLAHQRHRARPRPPPAHGRHACHRRRARTADRPWCSTAIASSGGSARRLRHRLAGPRRAPGARRSRSRSCPASGSSAAASSARPGPRPGSSHPAIVTLYEAAVDDEGAYLVSELVRGETLDTPARGTAGCLTATSSASALAPVRRARARPRAGGHPSRRQALQRARPGGAEQPGAPVAKLTDFGVARVVGGDSAHPHRRRRRHAGLHGARAGRGPRGRPAGRPVRARARPLRGAERGTTRCAAIPAGPAPPASGTYLPPLRRQRRDLPRELGRAIDLALRPRPARARHASTSCAALAARTIRRRCSGDDAAGRRRPGRGEHDPARRRQTSTGGLRRPVHRARCAEQPRHAPVAPQPGAAAPSRLPARSATPSPSPAPAAGDCARRRSGGRVDPQPRAARRSGRAGVRGDRRCGRGPAVAAGRLAARHWGRGRRRRGLRTARRRAPRGRRPAPAGARPAADHVRSGVRLSARPGWCGPCSPARLAGPGSAAPPPAGDCLAPRVAPASLSAHCTRRARARWPARRVHRRRGHGPWPRSLARMAAPGAEWPARLVLTVIWAATAVSALGS